MDECDVLVVGGGPAGSSCAWQLQRSGLDVVVMDARPFPRDKVCAGWITPQVIADLRIDPDDYRHGRTFQPISGFRVGLIDEDDPLEEAYDEPVSFGIRRCEFDHYLLQRSNARLRLGVSVTSVRRDGGHWIVNDVVKAPVLVGAGGHFCPVARLLNGRSNGAPIVAAQEVEFPIDSSSAASFAIKPDIPELYFCRDLSGYGWCFRKQHYVNIGFGSLGHAVPRGTAAFVSFLKARGRIPPSSSWRWNGHAYLLAEPPSRQVVGDAVMLVGDAAGLAYPQSGEGIRPAIESGLMAAATIVDAKGRYTRDVLSAYERLLRERFGTRPVSRWLSRAVPKGFRARSAPWLFGRSWFVRHLLLDRWFLHAHEPAMS
jgi:flavin-dependent dehydrogenase